jgi:hypothetical protein
MKSTKHQHSSSRETSMANIQTTSSRDKFFAMWQGVWSLRLGISLELGGWCLEFSPLELGIF